MTLKEIGYLLTVAQCASISEASKQLYVAQPSLTHAIQTVGKGSGVSDFRSRPFWRDGDGAGGGVSQRYPDRL